MRKIKIISQESFNFNAQGVAKTVLKVLKQTGSVSVELSIVSEEEIKRLNSEFRSIDKVTDVLSFPLVEYEESVAPAYDEDRAMLGDIVISLERAAEQAEEFGHSFEREVAFLTAHSMLHLLGYDHELGEDEDADMRRRQREIMTILGLEVK